ncbi:Uncharacterised protein [Mycobacteroides abscessus]|nr:Uncharacterised protein [Mycobacteroides abscessus]CPW16585.1 Uncharacterised protein [Mycobacteroides abscessus]
MNDGPDDTKPAAAPSSGAAAYRKASDSPITWFTSARTVSSVHGVGLSKALSGMPGSKAATAEAAGRKLNGISTSPILPEGR